MYLNYEVKIPTMKIGNTIIRKVNRHQTQSHNSTVCYTYLNLTERIFRPLTQKNLQDTIKAIWMILKEGKNGEAYNIVNEANTMRIRDMALTGT